MSEEVRYVYYEGPNDELVRDWPPEGDDIVYGDFEMWNGSEWVDYYGNASDLVLIDEEEAKKIMGEESPARTYPPGFVPVGKAEPMIDRDEVWVH